MEDSPGRVANTGSFSRLPFRMMLPLLCLQSMLALQIIIVCAEIIHLALHEASREIVSAGRLDVFKRGCETWNDGVRLEGYGENMFQWLVGLSQFRTNDGDEEKVFVFRFSLHCVFLKQRLEEVRDGVGLDDTPSTPDLVALPELDVPALSERGTSDDAIALDEGSECPSVYGESKGSDEVSLV